MTPVLLLDVDGVINALTKKPNPAIWPFDTWKFGHAHTDGRDWKIAWSTEVVDWLNALHDSGRAEIRWHTTWQHDAQRIADLVGLNTFAVADASPEVADGDVYSAASNDLMNARRLNGQPQWWKYGAAHRVLADEGRPLIWMDDDITWELPRARRDNMATNHAVLFIAPDKTTGLIPRHLRQVEEFLDGVDHWAAIRRPMDAAPLAELSDFVCDAEGY